MRRFLIIVFLSTAAFAQDFGAFDMGSVYINAGMHSAAMSSATASSAQKVVANPQTSMKSANVALSFKVSNGVTQRNLANFANKTRATDPEGAAKMEAMFASVDIIAEIGKNIAPYGLKTNNVADAYAVYWINAWEASRGIVGSQETRQRAQAVRTQASNAMAAVPALATATDAQKQEFAEALLIQAGMIALTAEAAVNDPAQLRAVGAAVAKGAKAMGLDLDTMDLTEDGFVPVKERKTGAADSTDKATNPAADPTAVAANDTANGDTGKWALIAAAGGAGLAGVFLFGKATGKKG
jgi:hypothetical protein